MSRLRVIVFDAYGTLLDIQTVLEEAQRAIGPAAGDVVDLWRAKQLEYSWLRTMMGTYADFEQISSDSLTYALAAHSASIDDHGRRRLLDAWFRPRPFPDVPQTLSTLQREGLTLAILSNGNRAMLDLALENSHLASMFSEVMSVDEVSRFKPDPAVYALACERLNVDPSTALFVSSNGFDVAGAKAFGFVVCWVNRRKRPLDELGQRPDHEITSMRQLLTILE